MFSVLFSFFFTISQYKDIIQESKSLCNAGATQTFRFSLNNNIEQFRIEASVKQAQNVTTIVIDDFDLTEKECAEKPSKISICSFDFAECC